MLFLEIDFIDSLTEFGGIVSKYQLNAGLMTDMDNTSQTTN